MLRPALRSVAVALCLAALPLAPAMAQVPPSIAALDPDLMMLRLAGKWAANGDQGIMRLLVTNDRATGGMRLFAQWVGARAVVSTVEVKEIAANRLKITSIKVDAGAGETAVHLGVAALDGGMAPGSESTTLILRGPGQAEYAADSN